jgi:uncharacterized protein (TIGR02186 family)
MLFMFLLVGPIADRPAAAQPLTADLSDHLIKVTAGFTGAKLLLFGALDGGHNNDVVVVISGPKNDQIVRRKDRVGVIWINREHVEFAGVPSYYYVASNRPLDKIVDDRFLRLREIGFAGLRLDPATGSAGEMPAFRAALIRNLERQSLYYQGEGDIKVLGNRLFRTDVSFPSNVPTGKYEVTTYVFRQGNVVSAQTTPLFVSKIGVGAQVYDFASNYSALYGATAIAIALFAGWLAGAVFRKT